MIQAEMRFVQALTGFRIDSKNTVQLVSDTAGAASF